MGLCTPKPRQGELVNARLIAAGTSTVADVISLLRTFRALNWLVAVIATGLAIVAIGIPTHIIPNDWFVRMTPVRLQDYIIWAISAPLIGLTVGSFVVRGAASSENGKLASGGIFSFLAVGCPICNKIVVFLIGTSGALTFYGPLQLYLGMASVLLLAWALVLRARAISAGCPVPLVTNAGEGIAAHT